MPFDRFMMLDMGITDDDDGALLQRCLERLLGGG